MKTPRNDVVVLAAQRPEQLPPAPVPEGAVPTWVDYPAVLADLSDDGVAAPERYVDGMRAVVEDARSHGVDLKVVYTEAPSHVYTQARDLAIQLAETCDGCTVLVRTPSFVGSQSTTLPRAVLEAGQDDAYRESDPVLAATVFTRQITQPAPPWGVISATIFLALVLVIVTVVVAIRRRG